MTSKQARRPWESPPGWVPLSDAFVDHLFLSAWGSSWVAWLTPRDVETAIAEKALSPWLKFSPDALPDDIRESVKGVDAARFYTRAVCDYINKAVRSGRLRTAYKPKGAGALQPMPLDAWETDHPFLRFDGWSFDPDDNAATGRDLPCWVFVDSDNLRALDAELEDWRKRLPRFMGEAQERDNCPPPSFMLGSPVSIWGGDDLLVVSCPSLPSTAPARRVIGSEVVATPTTVPKATRAEMQTWVVGRIKAGDTLTDTERTFRNAIPGKVVKLDREQLREMWRVEYEAVKGEMVRPGKRVKGE